MSVQHREKITCPGCKKEDEFLMLDSVDVTLEPEYKKKILDGSLFLHTCSRCGSPIQVEYEILYQDTEQKTVIRVCRDSDEALNAPAPAEALKELKAGPEMEHGRIRCVAGVLRLIEKIRIFDAGLDDFAVEILKAWLWKGIEGEKELYFDSLKEGKLEFAVCYEDGECCGFTVPYEDYEECIDISGSLTGKDLLQYVDCTMFLPMFEEENDRS